MKSLFQSNASGNLGVTFQTFERPFATELMAARAIGSAIQRLVCAGKRAWRNLSTAHPDLQEDGNSRKKAEDAPEMLPFQLSHESDMWSEPILMQQQLACTAETMVPLWLANSMCTAKLLADAEYQWSLPSRSEPWGWLTPDWLCWGIPVGMRSRENGSCCRASGEFRSG